MAVVVLVLYVVTGGVSDIHDQDLYLDAKPSPSMNGKKKFATGPIFLHI